MWPNHQFLDLMNIEIPIIQAPMAGANGSAMAVAVSEQGGLGSLPCAMLDAATTRTEMTAIRQQTDRPVNLNFFCHDPAAMDRNTSAVWRRLLDPFYSEAGLDESSPFPTVNRSPFDETLCEVIEEFSPEMVSFHFGLPKQSLVARVKGAGCRIMASATTVKEAQWLAENGCDAIIAQGYEAGGHRGMFMTETIESQVGTMALVPQIVDAVNLPVIAAGGIGDGRGIAAAFSLGAAAVQMGTAYLLTPESIISDLHRSALVSATEDETSLTNLFTGRPARSVNNRLMREIGPISAKAPPFPTAGGVLAPLRAAAEAQGKPDFTPLWSGQAASLCQSKSAAELTHDLAEDAQSQMQKLAPA